MFLPGKSLPAVSRRYTLKTIAGLVDFILALALSRMLTGRPEFGGAIFVSLRVWILYAYLYRRGTLAALPDHIRNRRKFILAASFALSAMLLILFPGMFSAANSFVLLGLTALMVIRSLASETIISAVKSFRRKRKSTPWESRLLIAGVYGAILLAVWGLGAFVQNGNMRLMILAAFLGSSILSGALDIVSHESTVSLSRKSADRLKKIVGIGVYNTYIKTITYVLIAIQIVIMMFLSYLIYLPGMSPGIMIVGLVAFSTIVPLLIVLVDFLLKRSRLKYMDNNSLIVLGALLWIASGFQLYRRLDSGADIMHLALLLQMTIGAALIFFAIVTQERDIRAVVRFARGEVEEEILMLNTHLVFEWAFLLGQILILLIFTILGLIMRAGPSAQRSGQIGITVMQFAFTLLPAFFIWLAMNASLKQPLTREYINKLRRYFSLRKQGIEHAPLRERLNMVLVKKYTRRYGIKIVALLLRPFMYHRVEGTEKVNAGEGAAVFVCNHGHIYGPIITNLYIPFDFRPWIISHMIESREVARYILRGRAIKKKWIPKRFRSFISKAISPPLAWAMRSTNPIPVYRNNPHKTKRTFKLTVEAMEAEDNILIFPENPRKNGYASQGLGEFFKGFARIGESYFKKTGKCAVFYPIFASKKRRVIRFGDGIRYDPKNSDDFEKERLARGLHDAILGLAAKIEG
jgi:1-acyl-sn-glycerol-3-phosphate acyltransferase